MLRICDWLITKQQYDNLHPNVVYQIETLAKDDWENHFEKSRSYMLRSLLVEHKDYHVLHKVCGDKLAYKWKNKVHYIPKEDVVFILRIDREYKRWVYVQGKTPKGLRVISSQSKGDYAEFPLTKTMKNAELVVSKGKRHIYRIKKELDKCKKDFTYTDWNALMGIATHEDETYRYYCVLEEDHHHKVKDLTIYRTRDDLLDSLFSNLNNNHLVCNPLDNGTIKVSI